MLRTIQSTKTIRQDSFYRGATPGTLAGGYGWGFEPEVFPDPIDRAGAIISGGAARRDPQTIAYPIAASEAYLVNHEKKTEGLASFAQTLAKNTENNSDFVEAFGVFIRMTHGGVTLANDLGISVSGNSTPVIMLQAGHGAGGFSPEYQDSLDTINVDQTHHFAAFFQVGFLTDAVTNTAAAVLKDLYPYNQGDINLGIRAGLIGSFLRNGSIAKDEVSGYISDLCTKH